MSEEKTDPKEMKKRIEKFRERRNFKRQNSEKHKNLGKEWRKPRGRHSKVRLEHKNKKKLPKIGRRTPEDLRGVHPSGFEDILVHNLEELKELDPERQAARIAKKVGMRKKEKILEEAAGLGIKVLNK